MLYNLIVLLVIASVTTFIIFIDINCSREIYGNVLNKEERDLIMKALPKYRHLLDQQWNGIFMLRGTECDLPYISIVPASIFFSHYVNEVGLVLRFTALSKELAATKPDKKQKLRTREELKKEKIDKIKSCIM